MKKMLLQTRPSGKEVKPFFKAKWWLRKKITLIEENEIVLNDKDKSSFEYFFFQTL